MARETEMHSLPIFHLAYGEDSERASGRVVPNENRLPS